MVDFSDDEDEDRGILRKKRRVDVLNKKNTNKYEMDNFFLSSEDSVFVMDD